MIENKELLPLGSIVLLEEGLRVTNNLLGRFLNSGQIWVDSYSGHFQQGFQGVERGL